MGDYSGDLIKGKGYVFPNVKSGSYSLGNDLVKSDIIDYVVVITETDYNALVSPDPKILYLIIEG